MTGATIKSPSLFTKDQGFALIAVVLIAFILVLISLSMLMIAHENIRVATEIKAKADTYSRAYSEVQDVIFTLSTSYYSSTGLKVVERNGRIRFWNFYGKEISLGDGISLKIQDLSAKIPIIGGDTRLLRKLLVSMGFSSLKVNSFIDSLQDWIDKNDFKHINGAESWDYKVAGKNYIPRNFYLQLEGEIRLILGTDNKLFDKIKDEICYYGTGNINFLNSSFDLLQAVLGSKKLAKRLVDLRDTGKLTPDLFRKLTGIGNSETTILYPSDQFAIEVRARDDDVETTLKAVYFRQQTAYRPYSILQWKN